MAFTARPEDRSTVPATIGELRRWSADRLRLAGVEAAQLEADVLLAQALEVSRAWLLAHAFDSAPSARADTFRAFLRRRLDGEPLAYIVGTREFFGRSFAVDPRVLIPRPETELLVEEVLTRWPRARVIADIGTGNGALAVTLALEMPSARVHAVDLSAGALAVARLNAERHGVSGRVRFHNGDLLAPLPEPVDVLVANLPYVSRRDMLALPPEVAREPSLALDGGDDDGLALYRRLFACVVPAMRPGGLIVAEIGSDQGECALELARRAVPGADAVILTDLAGLDRVVRVVLPGPDERADERR
jgi:release factor glutamine methyltransferase